MRSPSVSYHRPIKGKGRRSRIYYLFWRDPATGKVCKESTGTSHRSVAQQFARDKERKLALESRGLIDRFDAYQETTWESAKAGYLDHATQRHADHPQSVDATRWSLLAFERIVAPKKLRDVTTEMLQDFAAKRMTQVSPATVNKDLRHIRALLRWCHRRHLLRVLPVFAAAFQREDDKLPVVIPAADITKLRTAIGTADVRCRSRQWWHVFVSIAEAVGARRGEILGLVWSQVDVRGLSVSIKSTISKGRRDRVVPIDLTLGELLARWWVGEGEPAGDQVVLPWPRSSYRRLYSDWERICEVAGVRVVFKHFRSTCGSELVNSGTPTVLVRDWLGHSSVKTTEKFYLAPSQDALRTALARRRAE
jgi:integrase